MNTDKDKKNKEPFDPINVNRFPETVEEVKAFEAVHGTDSDKKLTPVTELMQILLKQTNIVFPDIVTTDLLKKLIDKELLSIFLCSMLEYGQQEETRGYERGKAEVKIVYRLAVTHEYEEDNVVGIFSTKEKAFEEAKKLTLGVRDQIEILEFQLDDTEWWNNSKHVDLPAPPQQGKDTENGS